MNSLGIGTSGKSYSLLPHNQLLLNSVKNIKGFNKNNKNKNDENKKEIINNFSNDIKNIRNQQNINTEPVNTCVSNINIPNVNWSDIFGNVCKQRLFSKFMDLKKILNQDPEFKSQLICYIDEECAKFLVNNNKNKKLLTLRMHLNTILNNNIKNSNINLTKTQNINNALELIKQLEQMGPSNNLLISLNLQQIKYVQDNYIKSKNMFWPNGDDGITWLTKM